LSRRSRLHTVVLDPASTTGNRDLVLFSQRNTTWIARCSAFTGGKVHTEKDKPCADCEKYPHCVMDFVHPPERQSSLSRTCAAVLPTKAFSISVRRSRGRARTGAYDRYFAPRLKAIRPLCFIASSFSRFAGILANACARLEADVVRYSFIVVDLHHLLPAGLPAHLCENANALLQSRIFASSSQP
jgi:hypothetical protein